MIWPKKVLCALEKWSTRKGEHSQKVVHIKVSLYYSYLPRCEKKKKL